MMPSLHRPRRARRDVTRPLRLLLLAAALTSASLLLSADRLAAQPMAGPAPVPDRPRLEADADTNDWAAYYRYGIANIRKRSDRATAALYWAAQLAPNRADALYAQWGSSWLTKRMLLAEHFRVDVGNRTTEQISASAESRAIDLLYWRAMLRNPFVHQTFERALQAAVLDRQYGRGKWSYDADESPLTEGWIAYTEGRFRKAADIFAVSAHRDGRGNHPEYRLWRARSLVFLQQYDSAAATLDTMIVRLRQQRGATPEGDASSAMLEYTLGVVHVMRDDRVAAKAAFGRAIERELDFYMAHAAIGGVKLAEGDTAGAIAAYEDAVAINGDDAVLRHDVGVVLLQAGRTAEAVRHLQRAVALAPWFATAYYNLAVALEREKRGPEAVERYRQFIARAPRSLAPQVQVAREHVVLLEATAR